MKQHRDVIVTSIPTVHVIYENETNLGEDTVSDDEFQVRRQQEFRMDFHFRRGHVCAFSVSCRVRDNEKTRQVQKQV